MGAELKLLPDPPTIRPAPATLIVDGPPVQAARARATVRHGHAHIYSPTSNVLFMDRVRAAFDDQHHGATLPLFDRGEPVAVTLEFVFARPASHYGTGRNSQLLKASAPTWHTGRPDIDNLAKLVLDALAGRLMADDRQVVRAESWEKRYCGPGELPHTRLDAWVLG